MEYESKAYFEEHDTDDVKGFTVLAADDSQYHIAEKWLRDSDENVWLDYWIPERDLLERVENGDCEFKAKLTDEQFEQVCDLVGWYTDSTEEQEVIA